MPDITIPPEALKAWPGARIRTTFKPNEAGVWIDPVQMWSLPLTQENINAEA